MKIRLSVLMIPMALAVVMTNTSVQSLLAYISITIHETGHLLAALCIGLRPAEFLISPFGTHLSLKNKIVYSIADEIILYSAGPLINLLIALFAAKNGYVFLQKINIALFVMNILPIIPLDGGMIIKRVISYKYGLSMAENIIKTISICLALLFFSMSVYEFYNGNINLSMFIMSLFLVGNALTAKELYSCELITGINRIKKTNKVKLVLIDDSHTKARATREISPSYTTIAAVVDKEGQIALVHEKELIADMQ